MDSGHKKVLLVLGMHRSGTSLLSGWLQKSGLFLGDRLMPEGEGNPKGHFEDLDFHDFHEATFKRCGMTYGGFEKFERLHWDDYEKEKLKALFHFKLSLHDQWGFKDPRTILFLPLYQELPMQWKAIAIFRPYEQVVDSLLRREWQYRQELLVYRSSLKKIRRKIQSKKYHQRFIKKYANYYLNAWITYNEKLLKFCQSSKENCLLFPHSSLLHSERAIAQKLQSWGFELEFFPIADFFDSSLMNTKPAITLPLSSDLKERAEELQKQLFLCSQLKS